MADITQTVTQIDNALAAHEHGATFGDTLSEDAMRWTAERTTGLPETRRERRGHDFYPTVPIPALYATDGQPFAEKTVHAHYFVGGCDWWVVEYDPAEGLAFGYACLGDPQNAEWGYTSLPELEEVALILGVVERDCYWTPKPAGECNMPGQRFALNASNPRSNT